MPNMAAVSVYQSLSQVRDVFHLLITQVKAALPHTPQATTLNIHTQFLAITAGHTHKVKVHDSYQLLYIQL